MTISYSERKNDMKKYFILLIVAVMLFSLGACAKKKAEVSENKELTAPARPDNAVVGGWAASSSYEITDSARAIFDKGAESLLGVNYEPAAYLGTQIVAGTNHCFLAKATVVAPGTKPYYTLVFLYEDLDGNVHVKNVAYLPIIPGEDDPEKSQEEVMGGWEVAEDFTVTEEISDLVSDVGGRLLGAKYAPCAYLGKQIVSGTNHCVLCQITPITKEPVPHYALVYIYEDLDGKTELVGTTDIDIGYYSELGLDQE